MFFLNLTILKDRNRCVITLPGCTCKPFHSILKCLLINNMGERININLLDFLIVRNSNLKNTPAFVGESEAYIASLGAPTVYCFIQLLMMCDATHDFSSGGRKKSGPTWGESNIVLSTWIVDFWKTRDSKAERGILRKCVGMINPKLETADDLVMALAANMFNSDGAAKKTIHQILKLFSIDKNETYVEGCGENYTILNILQGITLYNTRKETDNRAKSPLMGTIDQSSDKLNLIPFFSELIKTSINIRRNNKAGRNVCPASQIKAQYTLATKYDASNDDALQSSIISLGLSEDKTGQGTLSFDIYVYDTRYSIFKGSLIKENGIVKLLMQSYFGKTPPGGSLAVSGAKNSIGETGNSVNGIVSAILQQKATIADENTFNDSAFFLMGSKTMGDFLQIMTFLHSTRVYKNAFFLTFDISCAEIASMFHKNVFLENTFNSRDIEGKLLSGLVYFRDDIQRDEELKKPANVLMQLQKDGIRQNNDSFAAASALAELGSSTDTMMSDWLPPMYNFVYPDGNSGGTKRSRNGFGKKKPKVKNLPNKALMTKLKSVGIKITKKQGKRRVYLSRPELIKRATAFRNLQLRAKKLKVRIMYKNKKGKYVYKTAKRLMNDIKRQIKKPVKKRTKKPVKKQMKKPVKKSNLKQMKQRFG